MQSDDDLRPLLRRHLGAAVRHRDRIAVAALREAIAALDNAEAIPPDGDLRLRLASTSQVGSLVLARPRPSVGYSMPKLSAQS